MKIADIRFETRVRQELGDIEALAKNIEAVGLLQPIAVNPDGILIAGYRRLIAAQHLG